MELLNPDFDFGTFFKQLNGTEKRLLMLDYDGTLAPFRKERDKAFPYPGIRTCLEKIIQNGLNRVIIISGRSINDLVPLLGLENLPELWGSHGGERLTEKGTQTIIGINEKIPGILENISRELRQQGWGEMTEYKPLGLALHWRGMSRKEIDAMKDNFLELFQKFSDKGILCLHEFDGGLELRPPGISKGDAVRKIIDESGNTEIFAYLGDDLTDEDAFRAIKIHGLAVLVRGEPRETSADLWLRPPGELIEFLKHWF